MAKNIELYNKTVEILYQAYFDDTLTHGNCQACAVGNMVAANMGIPVRRFHIGYMGVSWARGCNSWHNVFMTETDTRIQLVRIENYSGDAKVQIDSTGYAWHELAAIELAFEKADSGNSEEDHMFNGLVAVLEVLKQIHEIDDNTDQVERFTAHHRVRVSA